MSERIICDGCGQGITGPELFTVDRDGTAPRRLGQEAKAYPMHAHGPECLVEVAYKIQAQHAEVTS
jgi:hypothetical protein